MNLDSTEALVTPDGGCRDINLFGVDRGGCEALLAWLVSQFGSHEGTRYPAQGDAIPVRDDELAAAFADGGMIRGQLTGSSQLFDALQYCFHSEGPGEWFVELTFFPNDLHLDGSADPIEHWLAGAIDVAGAVGGYVRMEDASFDPTWENRSASEVLLVVAAKARPPAPPNPPPESPWVRLLGWRSWNLRRSLTAECLRELGPGHELHGRIQTAVARCSACDDVVFRLKGDAGFAVVHLSWSAREEPPPCPSATVLPTVLALESVMDHHEH